MESAWGVDHGSEVAKFAIPGAAKIGAAKIGVGLRKAKMSPTAIKAKTIVSNPAVVGTATTAAGVGLGMNYANKQSEKRRGY